MPGVVTFHENCSPLDFVQYVLYETLSDYCLKEADVLTSNFCVKVRSCVNCTMKVGQCFLVQETNFRGRSESNYRLGPVD